ncbi:MULTISPECIES: acyl carrier protein [unclassified Coleofasciculus]|uniref:acyl carrier protein n=1 Tax=unclassified Coleofasciculus TaxID=2692782 RepID=UPI00187FF5F9|nr:MULTISPECIES: acyl carrier protein [unclassified Coleofasciculus]MBE9128727.1 acyl carrier protein [Coleofasciculus sp. LEGE 07081]MBE9151496.1 acyl carrier protein [Coleofasciculus sp. LEGE 07092]
MEIQNSEVTQMPGEATSNSNTSKPQMTAADIQSWFVSYLSDLLDIPPDEIEVTIPFERYGLDSSVAVGMTGDLQDWLGSNVDPTLLYDYPTIESLAAYLADESKSN